MNFSPLSCLSFLFTHSLYKNIPTNTSHLNRQILTRKRRSRPPRIIGNNRLDSRIQPRTQQEQSHEHDNHMNDSHDAPLEPPEQITTVELEVRDGEEDEAEEGIEGRAEQGQEIPHRRHDLGEDESHEPDAGHDPHPDAPPDHGVGVRVSRAPHEPGVDEFRRDVRVDDADDERRHDDEGERGFLVDDDAEGAEGRSGGVLAEVAEADGGRDGEQACADGGEDGEGFGEVLGPLHLRDEGGEEDLRDPEEGDVQDGVHALYPGRAGKGEGVGSHRGAVGGVGPVIAVSRGGLDAGEDEEEEDREGHGGRAEHGHERDVFEGPGHAHEDAHQGHDDGEDDGAEAVVRERVEDPGAGEDVEADQEDVVGEEHEARELVGDAGSPERVVPEVADVSDLGVLHDEFPHGHRRDPEQETRADHGEDPGDPAEDTEGPGLCHDGEADLVADEEPGGFLPGHGAEFDFMLVVWRLGCVGRDVFV